MRDDAPSGWRRKSSSFGAARGTLASGEGPLGRTHYPIICGNNNKSITCAMVNQNFQNPEILCNSVCLEIN